MSHISKMYTPKSILITGGAGFIASHVAVFLAKKYRSYDITVIDKLDYCANLNNLKEVWNLSNFEFVKGDICSTDLIAYILKSKKIDTILHFAAHTHVDNSFGNSLKFTENNIKGTHVILETCKSFGCIQRFVHVSTDEVYGESSYVNDEANTETSILEPTNPYSATKAGAEMLVMAYGSSHDLKYIITRGNNVYGPGQFPEKAIPKFILLLEQGNKIPIHGDGQAVRSYMHVLDAVNAFDVILHKGKEGEVYNIAANEERTVKSVAMDICKEMNKDVSDSIKYVVDRKFNDKRYFIDCSKLINLGWAPKVKWDDGLKETVAWYLKHNANSGYWGTNLKSALLPHKSHVDMIALEEINDHADANVCERNPDNQESQPIFLIYGKTGWIANKIARQLTAMNLIWHFGEARLQNREDVINDILQTKCTHIINAAGVTGRPNVDWCEDNKIETIRSNVIGCLTLCDVALTKNIHVTNFATGCIYKYDDAHKIGGEPFTEADDPNFTGSFYSETKAYMEMMLRHFPNVMQCRVRMPIDCNLQNPRNFITKICNYERVVDIPNSMTNLEEFVPMAIDGALRKLTGAYNWTNPGTISHNEVLDLYKKYLDPSFTWQNFTEEEQANVIKAPRSNNFMCGKKIKEAFPNVLNIRESLIKYVFEPNQKSGLKALKIKKDLKN